MTGGEPRADRRRVRVVPDGPVLVDGPVDLVAADGSVLRCDRFVVAVCACRRSRRFPLCDTSHRRRERRPPDDGTA
ncbi:CDGSH iron-sulfur domain-containing protein [Saccharopolyspora sp. NFXS83]|uniref:CDGSH iron-sulfur domain-containing protein n=1 Tax=Saccharopolyspora sp. NFXS83 TaxID=2993560 RepID=UPI00224B3B82|nr:CDGSH iron-sulfur domain-containing protein [Saccharopolyspora sp. NFXS83]MCX2729246.1 CDGSH iron-sulfur domain-containing protein [Saccharopolyspora sp. NFXS83]